MIDSVLERSQRRIVLDRSMSKGNNNEVIITTSSNEIKRKVRQHLYEWMSGTN
ncbi:4552_t:CDS:2 [Diversispora eburnea]|uniref:4552_t:CDS:1 n=1 Tax=Diversispora eburnea TaxID=1213867 RepID=A0A9N9CBU2_9GLOM|nr:4552_t:CDS:2 [Diversispora eburnea]